MVQKKTSKKQPEVKYENNPFFVAGHGITLLFDYARGIAVLLLLISVINFTFNGWPSGDTDNAQTTEQAVDSMANTFAGWTANDWVLAIGAIMIIGLALVMISALFSGISAYTAWRLSRGDTSVPIRDAFRTAFDNLWGYIWLQIIITVKIILWSLLFIVPGIYFAFRYTLAGVAFFDDKKHLRGNAAVKESLRLTKGGWLTTFSSNTLFNILTFGILGSIVTTGVNTVLYRQFNALGDKPKPTVHWLTWVVFALPLILGILALAMLLAFLTGAAVGKADL